MTIPADFYQRYADAEAERGKFVPLDMSSLSPAYSGRGRYAILTHIVGSESGAIQLSLSGATIQAASAVYVTNDVLAVSTVNSPTVTVGTVSSVSLLPNTVVVKSETILANASSDIAFGVTTKLIEIWNNDTANAIYLDYNLGTSFANVTAMGMKIEAESYYSAEVEATDIVLANPNASATDVRVFGHYRS